jgi:primary-amine oxidase
MAHPLQRLGADEIRLARAVLTGHGLVGGQTRFAYLGLEEPPKQEVLAFKPGEPVERRVRAVLLDMGTGAVTDVVASLTRAAIDSSVELDPAVDGQPPIMLEDLVAVDEIVKADGGWRAAMARRGITELDLVRPCPLSAGAFGIQGEEGRRMLRVLSFVQEHDKDHPWAHPVDGLVAYVDLVERRVLHLIDQEVLPVPEEPGSLDDPAEVGSARTSLKPIQITQPEGPSFTLDGDEVTWEGWRLRIGFDAREGLTLHQLSLWDRPVVYRASVAERNDPLPPARGLAGHAGRPLRLHPPTGGLLRPQPRPRPAEVTRCPRQPPLPSIGAGALGVGYGIWLRSARPSVYRGIGLGADAGG